MDNLLDGGLGADIMAGGSGDDIYTVDQSGDVVVEAAWQGIDTVQSDISYTLVENTENLILTGAGNLSGTGNTEANWIIGNADNNLLDGAENTDTLIGGQGDDTYIIDNAGDVVIEAQGEGRDHVRSSVTYTLSDNVERMTRDGARPISMAPVMT